MDHFEIVMSLIGVMFLAIIGVYVWTYKVARDTNSQLGEIYKTVNSHFADAKIHANVDDLVSEEVFTAKHDSLEKVVDEIKTDVKCLLRKAGAG